jgi:hypothetical protein
MNKGALNPFAGHPNTLTVHPGWSEFHYLLAALASLLLLLGSFGSPDGWTTALSSRKVRKGVNSGARA